jgi:hypothetical protein
VDATIGLPDLPDVPAWPSLAGSTHTPQLSSLVVVDFLDGNPATPRVCAYEGPAGAAWKPTGTTIDATGTIAIGPSATLIAIGDGYERIVREGDTYSLGAASGVLTFVSTPSPDGPSKGTA